MVDSVHCRLLLHTESGSTVLEQLRGHRQTTLKERKITAITAKKYIVASTVSQKGCSCARMFHYVIYCSCRVDGRWLWRSVERPCDRHFGRSRGAAGA